MAVPRRNPTRKFWKWVRETLDMLCNRPDHLQRISIVGSGMSLYPVIFAMVGLLVWFALRFQDSDSLLIRQIVGGVINIIYILLSLFALVIVSMLGTIKGLSIGPRGLQLTTNVDDPDVDPDTRRDTRVTGGGGHGGGEFGGGYGGYGEGGFSNASEPVAPEGGADGDPSLLMNDAQPKTPGEVTP